MIKVGDTIPLTVCKQIDRVIWDYNRSRTCIKVLYKYSSLTDERIMPVQEGCRIWMCSRAITKGNFFTFVEYEALRDGMARMLDKIGVNSEENLEKLELEKEKAEFIMYAVKKLSLKVP